MSLENLGQLSLEEVLKEIATQYGDKSAFSTSLSWEDQVISHHIFANNLPIRVFTLDTGRMFPETYNVLNRTKDRYGKVIEVFFPNNESVEKLVTSKGPLSFYESLENRKECCNIRKVEPLNRALKGVEVWITGLRAEHSDNRKDLSIVEKDEQRNIIKVNPLLNWSFEEVKSEISKHNIPYNILHDKGFVSIGCQPCTRAIKEGEDFRAGRWWWEDTSKKECGLHS
ncbi:MAG: phosphoadenylyl-sulfate reductase [Fluviicola sp.]|jgi:phosphoadenosine phosphosulfate reductase|nr:phosphoadenylyl-sulfate reductase [Fluviicola sp.]